MYIGELL